MQLAETQLLRILEEQNQNSEEHSPYTPGAYQIPDQARLMTGEVNSASYVLEEREDEEDEDDEFEREYTDSTQYNAYVHSSQRRMAV